MYQIVMLSLVVILLVIYFWLSFYQKKKKSEYKNDERWQLIDKKVKNIAYYYNDFLIVLIAAGIVAKLFINIHDIMFSLDHLIDCIFLLLAPRVIIELMAYKYLDKRM